MVVERVGNNAVRVKRYLAVKLPMDGVKLSANETKASREDRIEFLKIARLISSGIVMRVGGGFGATCISFGIELLARIGLTLMEILDGEQHDLL